MQSIKIKEERYCYLDVLRTIAILGVITIHATCQVINSSVFEMPPIGSFDWNVAAVFNSLSRCSVPLFLMISGALFLNKSISLKELYTKYIFRLVLSYFVWSFLYAYIRTPNDWYSCLRNTLFGFSRFGFICYITGLYMISPLLKKICEDKCLLKYYIVLCVLFKFVIPQLCWIGERSNIGLIVLLINILDHTVTRMIMEFAMGMTGYYLLGYYIHIFFEGGRQEKSIIYVLGVVGFLATSFFTIKDSVFYGKEVYDWLDYCSINVLFESCAIFVFIREMFMNPKISKRVKHGLVMLSNITFGIYLIHSFVLDTLLPQFFNLNCNSFPALLSVPFVVIVTFLISALISFVLNKIPYIKKIMI